MQAAVAAREGTRPRVLPPLPPRGRPSAMAAILALSLAVHVGVIAVAALLSRPPMPAPPAEVAVEVVPEVPKEAETPAGVKDAAKGDAAKAEEAKAGQAKSEQAKSEQAKAARDAEQAKLDAAKPPEPAEQAKSEQAEAEQRAAEAKAEEAAERARVEQAAQAEQAKAQAEQARAEQAKAQAEQARAEQAKAEAAQAGQKAELQAMRDELARLQAEQQSLKAAEQAAQPALRGGMQQMDQAAGQPAGLGPLASSFQAIALPQETTDGEGELAGYQSIVFSRLAKAKAVGRQLGIPGSAGVAFTVDEHGALASLRLAVPSGIKKLDEEALAIVRRAAPFPVPPEGAQRSFEANVSFVAGG